MKTLTLIGILLFPLFCSQSRLDTAAQSRPDLVRENYFAEIELTLSTKLIAYQWKFLRGSEPSEEGYSYQFFANGTFIWSAVSDYSETGRGLWNYEKVSSSDGLLFLLWQKGKNIDGD